MTTVAFRIARTRRSMLEAIQEEKGHSDLSVTLRDAIDEYIERYLRRDPEARVA